MRSNVPTRNSVGSSKHHAAGNPMIALVGNVGVLAGVGEIVELRKGTVEEQADAADRAMTLLADDGFGDIMYLFAVLLPFCITVVKPLVAFVGALCRHLAFVIVLLAIHEHDDVGVLFDGSRFAQIGKLRSFVLALFDCTRQLR